MSAGCKDMPLDKALNIVDPDSHTRANPDMPIQEQKETFLNACRVVCAAVRHAEPENKPLTLFSAITESPEALAKFLRAVDAGKIKLSESFCKSDCGDDDGCPHELQCIINWLNQPYARKPERRQSDERTENIRDC